MYIIYLERFEYDDGTAIHEFCSCSTSEDAYLLRDVLEEVLNDYYGNDEHGFNVNVQHTPCTYSVLDEVQFKKDAIEWLDRGFR